MISTRKKILSFIITAVGLLGLFLLAVNTGTLKVSPIELFNGLFVEYDPNVATIYDLRFPRIFIAMFGGAATAVSCVLLQAVMKNPLADPGIIGVSSGASLAASSYNRFFPLGFLFHSFYCVSRRYGCISACLQSFVERRAFSAENYPCRRCRKRYVHRTYERIQQRHRKQLFRCGKYS